MGWLQRRPLRTAACTTLRSDRSRGGLFGTAEAEDLSTYDPEKLERQNDADIELIGERAKHLKEARARTQLPSHRASLNRASRSRSAFRAK